MNPSADSPETRIALFQRKRDPLRADACKGGGQIVPPLHYLLKPRASSNRFPVRKNSKQGKN